MITHNACEAGEDNFNLSFAAMMLSFDRHDLDEKLASWLRMEGYKLLGPNPDEDAVQDVLEIGFRALVQRRAIAPIRPFSVAGQKQFDALTSVTPTTVAAPVDPLEEVIADFGGRISAADFKRKCRANPQYAALFEQAVAAGRV